uniref:G-protein coupled receptors family 1 profile domain-containing protein n=1 Tax=Periophthalmus magnuspinnatus TaxID=409849 RepID=A0A3B3ZB27_9GOBI
RLKVKLEPSSVMSLNSSASAQSRSVLERALAGVTACLLCLVFLWVNFMMLYTLRSRAVFREAARHVLLFHLLFSDTLEMVLSQVLFVLAYVRVLLFFPLCALLVLMTHASHNFSPLMLVLMSLERFVAVCLPLRHAAIATPRNSTCACLAAWAFTIIMILVRLSYMLPPSALSVLRSQTCHSLVLYPTAESRLFDEALLYSLFLAAFLSIAGSYAAVMRAAHSLSTDQASARKARTTLLLHLFQLSLMVVSTFHDFLLVALYRSVSRLIFSRVQTVMYIFLIILPKCLSVLVYGLRDPTIRAALVLHLCCHIGLKQ